MSADAVYFYFGVRFTVASEQELNALEEGTDQRLVVSRTEKLDAILGRVTDGEDYFLLIGYRLGTLGVENAPSVEFSEEQLLG